MEERQTLLENENLTLWYLPRPGLLWHEVHTWTCGPPFRLMLETGLACMKAQGLSKWLSDNRNNNALPPNDEEWIHFDWFPRALEAGWRYWAIVPPVKVFGEKNMRRYAERYETYGLKTKVFSQPEDALSWLVQPASQNG